MRRPASLAAALLLAACATIPEPPLPLEGIPPAFELAGRLSIAQGGQGEILRIRWSRSRGADAWVLASPMGTELARIERKDGEPLVVRRPNAAPLEAASFSDLTENLLGTPIDERLLLAWVHARPVSGPDGWTVVVEAVQQVGGVTVARRITARRDDTVVKLVVDDYREPGA